MSKNKKIMTNQEVVTIVRILYRVGDLTKGRELAKALQENTYTFLSTGLQTYCPSDTNKFLTS